MPPHWVRKSTWQCRPARPWGAGLPLTAYPANFRRQSLVEKNGTFYLMVSFCLKHLGEDSQGEGEVRPRMHQEGPFRDLPLQRAHRSWNQTTRERTPAHSAAAATGALGTAASVRAGPSKTAEEKSPRHLGQHSPRSRQEALLPPRRRERGWPSRSRRCPARHVSAAPAPGRSTGPLATTAPLLQRGRSHLPSCALMRSVSEVLSQNAMRAPSQWARPAPQPTRASGPPPAARSAGGLQSRQRSTDPSPISWGWVGGPVTAT